MIIFVTFLGMAQSSSAPSGSPRPCPLDDISCQSKLPSDVPTSKEGVSLIQSDSTRSILPTHFETELPESDEDILPPKSPAPKPKDTTFYLGVCLDILIVLIIADGGRRYSQHYLSNKRDGAHSRSQSQQSHSRPARTGAERVVDNQKSSSAVSLDALHAAVREADAKCCEMLLSNLSSDGSRKLLSQTDDWGCSALHLATEQDSEAVACVLLRSGADVNARDAWDQAPLHFAARKGSNSMCSLLISHGADPDVVDADGHTPLLVAARSRHEAACKALLQHGGGLAGVADSEVPPMLSALLVERMFERPSGAPVPMVDDNN